MDRRQALVRGVDLPTRARGAVLFADICGFTQLSGRLTAALGPRRGVDALSGVLHSVYEVLLHEIHQHAGSAIGFSGDAVMCWFDDQPLAVPGDPPNGARRAVAAGLRVHEGLQALPAVQPDDRPPVKIGVTVVITSGPVSRLLVGDAEYGLIPVLGGATVTRIGDLHALLDRVVVDEATLAALGLAAVAGADQRGGTVLGDVSAIDPTPWPPLPGALDESVVAPWAGRHVRQRGEASTDLRPTVAVFVDFRSLDFDHDPHAAELLDRFVRWVQTVIARGDGSLLQVTVGDKDSYLYVSFGALRAYEDLAARAASAALTLRELPVELASMGPLRIGLAHGVTRVGAYGATARGTHGALGDGTNLAARLMTSAASGEIVMTSRVAHACGPGFLVEPRSAVVAKGFADPVEVVELVGRAPWATASRDHRRRLVGRDRELAALIERVGGVTKGAAPTTVITGDAGVGKSHLIAEAKRRLLADASVTWLDCRGGAQNTVALAPFVALLRDLTFQELAADDADRRALFETSIGGLCSELVATGDDEARRLADSLSADLSYLAALVGLRWEESPYEAHDPRTRFDRCLEAYVQLLRAESRRRSVVLHVDDGQWLDVESRRLVELVEHAAVGERIALVISGRSTGEAGEADALVVGPLGRDGVAGVAASRLGGEASSDLVDLLLARSRGNPLFADQLALAMEERGWLRFGEDGQWWLQGIHDHELPVSLTTLLVSRLDGLADDVRELVQRAAVVGVDVELDVLAAMLGGDIRPAVVAAAAAGIWDVEGGRAAFRHELLRDAAYQMQPDARLRAFHASVARALIATSGDGGPAAAELAHHWEHAGELEEAFTHLVRAAADAAQLPAHQQARAHLVRAAALAGAAGVDDEELAAVHSRLAEVAAMLGEYATAVDELTTAAKLSSTPTTRVDLLCRTGETYERWGRLGDAEAAYEEALAILQPATAPGLAGRIYGGLATIAIQRGDQEAATELAELALSLVSSEADRDQIAEAHHRLAMVALQRGDLDTSADHARRSLAMFIESGRRAGQAAALNNLGLIALQRDDVAGAIGRFEEAAAGFEAVGNEPGLARALGNLADALAHAGRADDAVTCVERAVEILARIGLDERGVVASMWKAGSW